MLRKGFHRGHDFWRVLVQQGSRCRGHPVDSVEIKGRRMPIRTDAPGVFFQRQMIGQEISLGDTQYNGLG